MANDLGNPLDGVGANTEVVINGSEQIRDKRAITNLTLICSDYLLFLVIQQLTGSESRSRHVDSLICVFKLFFCQNLQTQ